MTELTIAQRTRETIAFVLGRDDGHLCERCRLRDDLGVSGPDFFDMAYILTGNGIWVTVREITACETVGDVVALMERKTNE